MKALTWWPRNLTPNVYSWQKWTVTRKVGVQLGDEGDTKGGLSPNICSPCTTHICSLTFLHLGLPKCDLNMLSSNSV